jgi:hypothetical protein
MPTYKQVDLNYFDTAPVRGCVRQTIQASVEATFACFEDPASWPHWIDPIDKVVWNTPKPFGVGTTRDIYIGKKRVSEYFFHWEQNQRFAFYFKEGEVTIRGFAEDYQLKPITPESCEVIWRYAFELPGLLRLLHPLVRLLMPGIGKKWFKQLAHYMQSGSPATHRS